MEKKSSTLRFIYPQWQGGIVAHWMSDIPAEDSSRGYYLGAQLLNYLAPQTNQKTVEVPVSLDINDRAIEKGISARGVLLKQTKAALELLKENNPDRIVTLGGECSVSVVPFTYLIGKYPDDVAIIWIDAHPDINLPYDDYKGYHAMALTACMGMGDEEIMGLLRPEFARRRPGPSRLLNPAAYVHGMPYHYRPSRPTDAHRCKSLTFRPRAGPQSTCDTLGGTPPGPGPPCPSRQKPCLRDEACRWEHIPGRPPREQGYRRAAPYRNRRRPAKSRWNIPGGTTPPSV